MHLTLDGLTLVGGKNYINKTHYGVRINKG